MIPEPAQDWSNDNSQETFELNDEERRTIPTMKPLPDEQDFGKEMVLSVALEHEAKRRKKKKNVEEVVEEDDIVEDNNIYSLDELTKIRSVEEEEKSVGPSGILMTLTRDTHFFFKLEGDEKLSGLAKNLAIT